MPVARNSLYGGRAMRAARFAPALGAAGLLVLAAWGLHSASAQEPAPKKAAAPEPARWKILFRSDNPALWDTNTKGKAIPLRYAPKKLRYLRLRRMDTGEALIIRLTPDQLRNGKPPASEKGFWWNGTAKEDYKGRHLGIVEGPRYKFPAPNGMISVMNMNPDWSDFTGSGFGHKAFVNDGQYYSWRGQEIGKTAFEIAVGEGPLTQDELRCLLVKR
jgi:hypothetical protein